MHKFINNSAIVLIVFLVSCTHKPENNIQMTNTSFESTSLIHTRVSPTGTLTFNQTATPSLFPTESTNYELSSTASAPIDWRKHPVIPDLISQTMISIFEKNRELSENPYSFSVIGDCGSSASWFLGVFDLDNNNYSLGEYVELEEVIAAFKGSFGRRSLAVGNGFNSASVLSPFWADQDACNVNETPLDCEIRINQPTIAFVLLGTNDVYKIDRFKGNLRIIIQKLLEKDIIPILATKADNLEKDHRINEIITDLAIEFDIPLWNYWLAVQPLPNHGLQADNAHLTWAKNHFDSPEAMQNAWPWRNLTALQMLSKLYSEIH